MYSAYFTVGTHSRANYSFNCSSFGFSGNWIVDLHRYHTSVLDARFLANRIAFRGDGTWHFTQPGRYRFFVHTECNWQIVVRHH